MGKSSEAKRGIPRKSFRASKRAKHDRYTGRSTCFACGTVFRSPKYKAAHSASGHKVFTGVSKRVAGQKRSEPGVTIKGKKAQ